MRSTPLGLGQVALPAALSLLLFCARPALARPQFGDAVDAFCPSSGGKPATPYAGDCSICHDAVSPGRDRTPGFDAYKDGDLGYFCPANQPPVLDPIGDQGHRKHSATRPCWSKGNGGCDDFMKLRFVVQRVRIPSGQG